MNAPILAATASGRHADDTLLLGYACGTTGEAFRDGEYLVVRGPIDLSARCVRCGEPAVGDPVVRTLSVKTDGSAAAMNGGEGTLGLVLGAVALLCVAVGVGMLIATRGTRRVTFGLCANHARRYRRLNRVAVGLLSASGLILAGGAIVAVASGRFDRAAMSNSAGFGVYIPSAVTLVSSIFFAHLALPLRARRHRAGRLWVSGAAPAFLGAFQQWTEPTLPIGTCRST